MGIYLNSKAAYTLYKSETEKPYFVDKTKILEELFPFVQTGNNHICITRPRRFGKTVMANMIAGFFSKAVDSKDIFQKLNISLSKDYENFIFYPETDKNADCIILELKVDHSPDEAIQQIKEKNYALRFQGKIGEKSKYSGRILAVGISYGREEKNHSCKVEVL